MARSNAREYYRTVNNILLEIKSLKEKIELQESELDRLIKKSGPGIVHAVSYDDMHGPSIILPDRDVMERISLLTILIPMNKETLRDYERSLEYLKKEGEKTAKKLDDLTLRVFIASYIDGKKNKEIAVEYSYQINTIEQIQTDIKRILIPQATIQ